jgi:Protein of unknown function (DUF4235)
MGTAVVYKPLGFTASMTSGLLARSVFKQVWKRVGGEDEAPKATDRSHGWGEVILAAALQGALFGAIKAIVDRGGASGFRRLTGSWPGRA